MKPLPGPGPERLGLNLQALENVLVLLGGLDYSTSAVQYYK